MSMHVSLCKIRPLQRKRRRGREAERQRLLHRITGMASHLRFYEARAIFFNFFNRLARERHSFIFFRLLEGQQFRSSPRAYFRLYRHEYACALRTTTLRFGRRTMSKTYPILLQSTWISVPRLIAIASCDSIFFNSFFRWSTSTCVCACHASQEAVTCTEKF